MLKAAFNLTLQRAQPASSPDVPRQAHSHSDDDSDSRAINDENDNSIKDSPAFREQRKSTEFFELRDIDDSSSALAAEETLRASSSDDERSLHSTSSFKKRASFANIAKQPFRLVRRSAAETSEVATVVAGGVGDIFSGVFAQGRSWVNSAFASGGVPREGGDTFVELQRKFAESTVVERWMGDIMKFVRDFIEVRGRSPKACDVLEWLQAEVVDETHRKIDHEALIKEKRRQHHASSTTGRNARRRASSSSSEMLTRTESSSLEPHTPSDREFNRGSGAGELIDTTLGERGLDEPSAMTEPSNTQQEHSDSSSGRDVRKDSAKLPRLARGRDESIAQEVPSGSDSTGNGFFELPTENEREIALQQMLAETLRLALAAALSLAVKHNDAILASECLDVAGVHAHSIVNSFVFKDWPILFQAVSRPLYDPSLHALVLPSNDSSFPGLTGGSSNSRRNVAVQVNARREILKRLVHAGANLEATISTGSGKRAHQLNVIEHFLRKAETKLLDSYETSFLEYFLDLLRTYGDTHIAWKLIGERNTVIRTLILARIADVLIHPVVTRMLLFKWRQRRAQAFRTYFVMLLVTILGTAFSLLAINNYNSGNDANFFMRRNIESRLGVEADGPIYQVNSADEIWNWLEGPVLTTAFASASTVGKQFQLVRGVRIRQLRVEKVDDISSCTILPFMRSTESDALCSSEYSSSTEDHSSFAPWATTPSSRDEVINDKELELVAAFNLTNLSLSQTILRTAFEFRDHEELNDVEYWGQISLSTPYGGGGYAFDLLKRDSSMTNKPSVEELLRFHRLNLQALKSWNWIDVRTRAIIVDFPAWNPSITRFALTRTLLELSAAGGIVPFVFTSIAQIWCFCLKAGDWPLIFSGTFFIAIGAGSLYAPLDWKAAAHERLLRMLPRYVTSRQAEVLTVCLQIALAMIGPLIFFLSDVKFVGIEILLGLVILLEFLEKVIEIRMSARGTKARFVHAFSRPGILIDLLLLPIAISVLIIQIYWIRAAQPDGIDKLEDQDLGPPDYVNLAPVMQAVTFFRYFLSILVLLLWFRLLELLVLLKLTGVFVIALGELLRDALKFGILLLIVLLGFGFSFSIGFAELEQFRSIYLSVITLLDQGLLGEISFVDLRTSNRVLGPLLFTMFVISCIFVLLTLLIAMFNTSFERLQANAERRWTLGWSQQLLVFEARSLQTRSNFEGEWQRFVTKSNDWDDPLFDREADVLPSSSVSSGKSAAMQENSASNDSSYA